jgi:hypothetical protein
MLTGGAIEFPRVPRTNHHVLVQRALTERSSAMGTQAIHRMYFTIDVAKCDQLVTNRDIGKLSRG